MFDDFGDPTPALYADLSREVHDFWDRGLLGMELDPGFAAGRPYVYVLYAYDKDPNSPAFPRWGDECPSPPGAMEDGCVVTGRLSRLSGGFEQVLIEDWCQQYSSHSLGSLAFGADGALYVSAGEGANYNIADWGQDGIPRNPCGDPPAVVGGAQTPPTAEGGALRAQDVLTPGDPTGLGGTVLRVDPDTGSPLAGQPGHGRSQRPPDRRLRPAQPVPHRHPPRHQRGVGRRGRLARLGGDRPRPEPRRRGAQLRLAVLRGHGAPWTATTRSTSNLCETLYSAGPGRPRRSVLHVQPSVARGGRRVVRGRLVVDLRARVHAAGQQLPARLRRRAVLRRLQPRLHLGDAARRRTGCRTPPTSRPSSRARRTRSSSSSGPNGDLYYVDLENGSVRRVRSVTTNHAPVARARADRSSGDVPLTVSFDGSASTDPDGRHDQLRLGPRRRRRVRRLDGRKPDLHVHGRRDLHRAPARHRSRRAVRHLQPADRRRPAAGPGHHHHVARRRARPGRSTTPSASAARRPTPQAPRSRPAA